MNGYDMVEQKLRRFVLLLICSLFVVYFSVPVHFQMLFRIPQEIKKLRTDAFEKGLGWFGDQWTEKEFSFFMVLEKKTLKIHALAGNPNVREKPLTLSLWVDGQLLSSFRLTDSQWKTISVEIPYEYRSKRKCITGRLSHTFVPRDYKMNEDSRHLGLLIRDIWTE